MIPSLVVSDIRSALVEYLASTFALADDDVRDALSEFLTDDSDGIFRGPYLRMRTPFRSVEDGWLERAPIDWLPEGFVPYEHQAKAFERLTSFRNHQPEPTLVTTGTGSGKTECFLYPILDHCRRERAAGRTAGVKALILYPMNALASDQASRLAAMIHDDPALAGITAGIYVGGSGRHSSMGQNHLIDQREVMRVNPPDILLTNYKMLDYLLLRREDRDLWATNTPDSLRYIVLDEFHTYDGAQGSDVAMLLRRLGTTLNMARPGRPLGDAVPVATSATLGTGQDAKEDLCRFAEKVFGTAIDEDAVIGESRQTVEESCERPDFNLPTPSVSEVLETSLHSDPADQLEALAAAFCSYENEAGFDFGDGWQERLGDRLLAHPLTRAVLAAVGDKARPWHDAVEEVVLREREWGRVAMTEPRDVGTALERFLWLLSVARRRAGARTVPLFSIEVQLWVREVSRLLRTVANAPSFRWSDSAAVRDDDEHPPPAGSELPSVYCRRCGLSGWMVTQSEIDGRFNVKPSAIYKTNIERPAVTRALLRASADDPLAQWYSPGERRLTADPLDDSIPVLVTPDEDAAKAQRCPACDERDAIRFLGLRVASLASVSINTLFGSVHVEEAERKLLAFTDSVQDASHRASFFSGRTHRINLRSLMSRVLTDQDGEPVTLETLGSELLASATNARDRFGLVPPDLLRDPSLRSILSNEPEPEALDLLDQRLRFEAALEFGLRSRVGRTLELSGAAAAHVHLPDIDEHASLLVTHIEQASNPTLFPDPERLHRNADVYLRGIVERLRLRGAIVHPLLDPYLANDGRQWFVWGGRPQGLPPFTPGQGRPIFATTSTRGDFDSLTAIAQTPTWWIDWGERTLGVDRSTARSAAEFAVRLASRESQAVVETRGKASSAFGLSPEFVLVVDQPDDAAPAGVRCSICGNRHAVAHESVDDWNGSACLRYRCAGSYQPDPPRSQNYYRRLYRSGITRRVVTAEHTGILKRAQREDLEEAFRAGTAPDAPNVIAATPTLEMGIDIGDLSAVMLTSVPPTPANYIQRVGRAGRSTGNALITTFVPTDTHGLYYLAQPEAMLAGEVRAPSCHLNAKDTLERQFFAFLIDRIADLSLDVEPVGREIQHVFARRLDEGSVLRQIVDAARLDNGHIEAFIERFGNNLEPATVDHMREFADEGLERRIKTVLDGWHEELKDLGRRRDRLNGRINALKEQSFLSANEDDELKNLLGQRALVIRKMREMRSEYALNALQRYGLTPNYTLVDDTAVLEASMWSHDDNDEFQTEIVEYTRSATMALREFAPGNSFYAVGHRHVVDAIDVGAADTPAVESWKLCPECGFGREETPGSTMTVCPRCGSPGIADMGARHQMLRFTKAYSTSSEERARVYDEDDDRRREQYESTTLVDVDPTDVVGAWTLVDQPFGAELAREVRLRSFNFGLAERSGDRVAIGGHDRHLTRFTTCMHCGAVEEARSDDGGTNPGKLHQGWCKVRSGRTAPNSRQLILYHELVTDAVRFLLPVSLFEIEERLASFKGALRLGLREAFGGDPNHLGLITSDMPNRDGQGRRNFIVLYDNVPGGTGYLAQLSDPDRVREILELGRNVISRCACRNESRQACHRCLLGAVDRREYDMVRRDIALDLLDGLLDSWQTQPVETVAQVDISRVEESELERRFKVALRDWAAVTDGVTLENVPASKGREAFELRIGTSDVIRWKIEEQEGLSSNTSTLPDFRCTRMDNRGRPVAIYLDGFQFHGSSENNEIAGDSRKRTSLRRDGVVVWSLTWNDVEPFHKAVTNEPPTRVPQRPLLERRGRAAAMVTHTAGRGSIDFATAEANPMELLLEYLKRPDDLEWTRLAKSCTTGLAATGDAIPIAAETLEEAIRGALEDVEPQLQASNEPIALYLRNRSETGLAISCLLDATDPAAERWTAFSVLRDDVDSINTDAHRDRWRGWLQWSNILQFLDDGQSSFVVGGTSQAAELLADAHNLPIVGSTVQANSSTTANSRHSERPTDGTIEEAAIDELELVDPSLADLLVPVLRSGVSTFVAGCEVNGLVVEAGWPDRQIGVLLDDQPCPAGWDARPVDGWTVATLIEALREKG